jgi:hypothetical protein
VTNTHITQVLDRLRASLGTGETPDGSNWNFIVDWYNRLVAAIGPGAWCEMTNTWAMWTGGAKILKTGRAYTVWAAQDAQQGLNGSSWHWGTAGMKAGDQVYYGWDLRKNTLNGIDHTGTVEKILGDGTFYVLEGNNYNKLQRVRRDAKYVVGYVRFDWTRLAGAPTPVLTVKNAVAKVPNKNFVLKFQTILRTPVDGVWGSKTDSRARCLRNASRAKAGFPKNVNIKFDIEGAQYIIGAKVDGVWGPKSQAALRLWISSFQRIAQLTVDGQWGPKTDNAFLTIRSKNYSTYVV